MPGSSSPSGGFLPGLTLHAYVQWNSSGAIVRQFGVASLVRSSAGDYVLNLQGAVSNTTGYMHEVRLQPSNVPRSVVLTGTGTVLSLQTFQNAVLADFPGWLAIYR